jgi:hypothetical protein
MINCILYGGSVYHLCPGCNSVSTDVWFYIGIYAVLFIITVIVDDIMYRVSAYALFKFKCDHVYVVVF